jgi:effector-binding domain-containing protein
MKKVFRFLGILILIIIVAIVVLGLIAPKDVTVERSIVINGDKDVVTEQVMMYSNYHNWNPWKDMDSNMKWDIKGAELQPGTVYHWAGEKVGEGSMTTREINGDKMVFDMHFLEPFESKAEGYYKIEDAGNGQTKVIQGFKQHNGFPMNGFAMAMGMGGMLEENFDKGLNKLKTYVESGKAGTSNSYAIQEVEFPEHTYATIRKTIGWDELEQFGKESFDSLGKAAGTRITGTPTGIFYTWDQENKKTDAAAGFPVSGSDPVKGATMVTIPASQAYFIEHKGTFISSEKVHRALERHMAANGKTENMVIEEYIVGREQEPDSSKWVTNIYYILK